MSPPRCCGAASGDPSRSTIAAPSAGSDPRPPTLARRALNVVGWLASSAILAFVPKCPACLAGYVALWTGVGLSITTATLLRLALIVLCIVSLSCLGATQLRRRILRASRS